MSPTKGRTQLRSRYLAALALHLRGTGRRNSTAARDMGRAALARGCVTLDLAIMHQQAVQSLAHLYDFADISNGTLQRAGAFFTRALVPLEAAQRATRQVLAHYRERNDALQRHASALREGNRRLEREVARRKAGEDRIRKGSEEYRVLFLESQAMQKKLRKLTHQIISVQENERKAISRELHDEVVQNLVGINVELEALARWASAEMQTLRGKISRAQRLVENSVKSVHKFARDLRPSVLDDLGLIPALHAYNQGLALRKNLKVSMTVFAGVETLSEAKRIVLFRVAQEALTNVGRHSGASIVKVTIVRIPGAVQMEIADNGRAFEVEKALALKANKRLGLVGMRERIEMVGGSLAIESAKGSGTVVRAIIPFLNRKSNL